MYDLDFESSYPTPYSSSPFLYFILLSMAGQKHTPDTKTSIKDSYDYIVVGSGSAGSIVASRLAEEECVTVLLLEAGKSSPKVTDLPGTSASFVNTDLDWLFKTVPQKYTGAALPNRSLTMSAGKTVGGTSTINDMQYIRGNKKDYDDWAAQGATGWSYQDVFPYFIKLENNFNPEFAFNGYHGIGGPVSVSRVPYDSVLRHAVHKAAEEMGYSTVDSNGARQTGFNDYQASMRYGQRCGTAKAYLVPNEHRGNLDIVANAYVRKVIIKDGQAEGVELDFDGQTREVFAQREVILSAGAIKSPHILMLSGVGPKEELMKHNIPVVTDLPVGLSLQEHSGVLLSYELGDEFRSYAEKLQHPINIWQYIGTKTGPLASLFGQSNMAFLSKDELNGPDDYPDYELNWGEVFNPNFKLNISNQFYEDNTHKDNASYWCLTQQLHPKSRGSVYLNSADPYDYPLIDPMYFSHPEDMNAVVAGMMKCKEFGESKPLRKIGSKLISAQYPLCEDSVGQDEEYFRCLASSYLISVGHQVGTVKMGNPDDPLVVLDPQLRVKNIRNLRVVDASVMPSITSGNTNVPVMMIAEKASDMIKETIQCPSRTL